ncbi:MULTISPECIES: tetratricopeptide repeat protein [unclassified Janthinobacterium]|uniref:TPR end-of-group domain-containing protein n=1 Tax=unclassified Janthinobacterium TaxID=2610881 RepID=UPI00089035AD|nr:MULTISPECIES: tetratricopeptide repeat protein [unclassified Janthinobacterium]SDA76360.1 Tetratricopeptide repeat [Janthinobacterium sp. 551a]SFB61107.1 Tetratricopeptide repeat [Janthinobacterium sp. 344]
MAKYKCPTLGDCDNANSGEVFERSPGDDVKCPKCDTPMELQAGGQAGAGGPNKKVLVAAVAGVLVLALGAGGYWYMQRPVMAAAALIEAAPVVIDAVAVAIDASKDAVLAPNDADTKALRIEGDQKLASGDAAGAETASSKAAANEMLKTAISRMAQGKLDEAEKELGEARLRDPHNVLVSYNVAILRLKQNRTDDALTEFEASFKDGFQYFDQMGQDRDLDTLRKDKRFQELLSRYQPQKS